VAANTLAPSGFHDTRQWGGSPPNYALEYRQLTFNYASNVAFGDPVYLSTDGCVKVVANGGSTIDGIAYGVDYFDPNNILSGRYHPAWLQPTLASTALVEVKVCADAQTVFYVQGRGTALTATSIGKNFDIFTGTSAAPVTGSGLSVCALDAGSGSTTSTLPFRLVGIVGLTPGFSPSAPCIAPGYVATNDNQWLAVLMNTQDLRTRVGQA
jgi:hypothetical protein